MKKKNIKHDWNPSLAYGHQEKRKYQDGDRTNRRRAAGYTKLDPVPPDETEWALVRMKEQTNKDFLKSGY